MNSALKKIVLPVSAIHNFLLKAEENSKLGLETLAFLCGKMESNKFKISHVLIPSQIGTKDSCEPTNNTEIVEYQEERNLVMIGWIHTHPTHSSFMSSIDLHTHVEYQIQFPESIAVVCSLLNNETDIYNLTKDGLRLIRNCRATGLHDHADLCISSIYQKAGHVILDNETFTEITDMRD